MSALGGYRRLSRRLIGRRGRDSVLQLGAGGRDDDGDVRFADGRSQSLDALFISPRYRLNSKIAKQIGCEIQDGPLGQIIAVDDLKTTTVDGVYAVGDIARSMHNISFACADGVMAAMAVHRSLVLES